MRSCTCIIKGRKNTRRSLFFDEVADDLVVEVLDGRPLDLLADVLLLLSLEGELDEDLLELLVDVVDAELLEGVVLYGIVGVRDQNKNHHCQADLENLETEDVLCQE